MRNLEARKALSRLKSKAGEVISKSTCWVASTALSPCLPNYSTTPTLPMCVIKDPRCRCVIKGPHYLCVIKGPHCQHCHSIATLPVCNQRPTSPAFPGPLHKSVRSLPMLGASHAANGQLSSQASCLKGCPMWLFISI